MPRGAGTLCSSGSVQIPKLIEEAQKGVARHIGRGLNVWSNVHIDDVSDLFLLALEHSAPGSLYYAENGESSMKAAVESISRMLGQGGKHGALIAAGASRQHDGDIVAHEDYVTRAAGRQGAGHTNFEFPHVRFLILRTCAIDQDRIPAQMRR